MMVPTPLEAGADQVTMRSPLGAGVPPTATTLVGAVGEPVTTPVEAGEAADVPEALVALSVKV